MPDYPEDRRWSDLHLDAVRQIVGPRLLVPAPEFEDCQEATDLFVLKARDMRVACRVRRPGYASRYPGQFTIRSQRDNGMKTELAKITEGFGDWLFYGHSDGIGGVPTWMIVDLAAWRAHMIRREEGMRYGQRANGDGTAFTWFDVTSFPTQPPILVDASGRGPGKGPAPCRTGRVS